MPLKPKIKKRLITGILTLVGTTFLMSLLALWNPLEKWQLKLTNHLYNRNEPSENIVIAGIDAQSISEEGLGRFQDWSREYYATVIENLEKAGVKVIGFDICFTDSSQGISKKNLESIAQSGATLSKYFEQTISYLGDPHPEDLVLAETLKKYKNIAIMDRLRLMLDGTTIENIPMLELFKKKVHRVSVLTIRDQDEVIRRIPLTVSDTKTEEIWPAFSQKISELYLEEIPTQLTEMIENEESMLINYAANPYGFKMISFSNIYNGEFDPQEIEGKIVLIGSVTQSVEDHTLTPTSPNILMPGVEVHANAIQTILEQKFLHEQSVLSQTITIALLTALLVTALLILGIIPGLVVTIFTIAGYYLSGQFFFNHGLILNFVYPILALFAAYLTITLYKSLAETQEKKQLTSAFSKYVNKDLVAQIANNPDLLKLGGEKRTVTVFFSDIENSTNLSEKMDPEALVSLLNEYFTAMTDIILKNKGTVNKFEGDAIMAFWGAPIPEPQHATLAAQSAIECRVAIKALHEKWLKQGNKPLIEFRIGLASGEVIAGNIGSQDRFDYTVMGDIVNLGSRLEGANKEYGTRIMISDRTYAGIQNEFETRHLDHLRVKGKENPVDVYELLTFKGKLEDRHRQIIDTFHAAMTLYREGKFTEAEQKFQEVKKLAPLDKTTDIYLKRLVILKQNPPANWDGTWTLDTK